MQHSSLLQRVRAFVERWFRETGAVSEEICETILVRDGAYCGRRFSTDSLQAVWFCEENEIKLYGAEGALVEVVRGEQFEEETISLPFPAAVETPAAARAA